MHLRDFSFPNFTFSKKHEKDDNRYILLTPFHANNTFPSYAWLLSTTGDLLWYKRGKNDKIISDFKQTTLPNGEKVYSYMQQEKPIPPAHYLQGSLIIMNNKFETINQLTIKETKKHPALLVENHDSLILDKNHFILSAYHETEILHPETEEPVFVTQTVIQEIKSNR